MYQPSDKNKIHKIESSADFLIKIMFRKNVNWQGEVHWLNSDIKRSFRSSLELLMLIHEAMEESEVPRAEYELRSWDKEQVASVKGSEEEKYLALFKEGD